MRVDRLTLSEWADALPATGAEVFHVPDALEALAAHTPGELRLYGGFKGDHPVALLPAFVQQRAVGRAVVSPPPSMGVPRLGPIVMPNSPKRAKQERVNREFVDAVLDEFGIDTSLTLCRIACPVGYTDPRPFRWSDLEVRPEFTYVLEVDGSPEEVMRSFSSSLRHEMRQLDDLDLTIGVEGLDAARRVYDDVADRYAEQDASVGLPWEFVRDVVTALEERCRVYVARTPDGDYLGGIIALYSDDTAYYWQGGVRASYDGVSVNSLLHRAIIDDIVADPPVETVCRYDLVGANTPRLCQYKAKFGGRLVPYYVVESSGMSMDLAKAAYRLVRG